MRTHNTSLTRISLSLGQLLILRCLLGDFSWMGISAHIGQTVLPFISDHPPPSAAHMDAVIAATPALDPDLASQDTQSPQSPPSTELTLHEETATDKLFGTAQVQARVATWQNEKMTLFVFGVSYLMFCSCNDYNQCSDHYRISQVCLLTIDDTLPHCMPSEGRGAI